MSPPKHYLAIIDVGHGNSAFIKDEHTMLVIDAGPKSGLLEFLQQENINEIDTVLLSHADEDHIGGLLNLLDNGVIIHHVRLNSDASKDTKIWNDLTLSLSHYEKTKNLDWNNGLNASQKEQFIGGKTELEIIGPSTLLTTRGVGGKDRNGRIIRSNSLSAIFRLRRDGVPLVLFAGDMDVIALNEIIHEESECKAPILIYPHHGGSAGAGKARDFVESLCDKVKPKMVVFSLGRSNKYNNPHPDVISSLRAVSEEIDIRCTQLSLNCSNKTPDADGSHLSNSFSSGRENNHCCSGTIIVDLDNTGSIVPAGKEHKKFIRSSVPVSLCLN